MSNKGSKSEKKMISRDKSNTSLHSIISAPMTPAMKNTTLDQLSNVIDKRNDIMKRHLLGETRIGTASQSSNCDDLKQLHNLKSQIKQIAKVMQLSQQYDEYATYEQKVEQNNAF